MVYNQLEVFKYEGRRIDMGKKHKYTKKQNITGNDVDSSAYQKDTTSSITQQNEYGNIGSTTNIQKQYVPIALSSLIAIIISTGISMLSGVWILQDRLSDIKVSIATIERDISDLKEDHSELVELKKQINENDGVLDQIDEINNKLNISLYEVDSESDLAASLNAMISKKEITTVALPLASSVCIGIDSDGNKHFADDAIGQTILLTYKEDENDVYFLGQFNENYRWDGYCITNVYNPNSHLIGICESNFSDGTRLNYKSIITTDLTTWDFADKECKDGEFIGENIVYGNIESKSKNFTNTNMKSYDIFCVDDLLDGENKIIIKYYCGKTRDGKYNDDTGNAYFVSYFEPGTFKTDSNEQIVKTIYQGKFVDGQFCDDSYNAWYITREIDTGYMYFKGGFRNNTVNKRDSSKEEFKNPLSFEDIKGYLIKYGYEDYLSNFYINYDT